MHTLPLVTLPCCFLHTACVFLFLFFFFNSKCVCWVMFSGMALLVSPARTNPFSTTNTLQISQYLATVHGIEDAAADGETSQTASGENQRLSNGQQTDRNQSSARASAMELHAPAAPRPNTSPYTSTSIKNDINSNAAIRNINFTSTFDRDHSDDLDTSDTDYTDDDQEMTDINRSSIDRGGACMEEDYPQLRPWSVPNFPASENGSDFPATYDPYDPKRSGSPLASWNIPRLPLDQVNFRSVPEPASRMGLRHFQTFKAALSQTRGERSQTADPRNNPRITPRRVQRPKSQQAHIPSGRVATQPIWTRPRTTLPSQRFPRPQTSRAQVRSVSSAGVRARSLSARRPASSPHSRAFRPDSAASTATSGAMKAFDRYSPAPPPQPTSGGDSLADQYREYFLSLSTRPKKKNKPKAAATETNFSAYKQVRSSPAPPATLAASRPPSRAATTSTASPPSSQTGPNPPSKSTSRPQPPSGAPGPARPRASPAASHAGQLSISSVKPGRRPEVSLLGQMGGCLHMSPAPPVASRVPPGFEVDPFADGDDYATARGRQQTASSGARDPLVERVFQLLLDGAARAGQDINNNMVRGQALWEARVFVAEQRKRKTNTSGVGVLDSHPAMPSVVVQSRR